jgi:hypothetical protein
MISNFVRISSVAAAIIGIKIIIESIVENPQPINPNN